MKLQRQKGDETHVILQVNRHILRRGRCRSATTPGSRIAAVIVIIVLLFLTIPRRLTALNFSVFLLLSSVFLPSFMDSMLYRFH
jgi:hypothetical protein